MAKACTFIGNRDLSLNEQWALRPRLQQAILNYLNAGGYFFACGGSYGFDLVAAEEVLNFKQYQTILSLYPDDSAAPISPLYLKVDDGRPATLTTGYAIQYLSLFLFCLSKRHLFRA